MDEAGSDDAAPGNGNGPSRPELPAETAAGVLRVGACQTPEILGDVASALRCIEDFAGRADEQDVDLLVFPECFLQGYLVEAEHVRRYALDLDSARFASVLRRLERIEQTLVFGVIEQRGDRCFNTAVVVARGGLVGVYRKTHLVPGEALFDNGDAYPTFALRGVRYGINICYDTQFAEAAAQVAAQGAQLLLVPAQNMMRRAAADHWKDLHHRIRAERARETGMWLVSADVTGERGEHRIGYGPTSVIDPRGEVVAQVPPLTTGMVVADVGWPGAGREERRSADHAPPAGGRVHRPGGGSAKWSGKVRGGGESFQS